ncbi:MAG: DUF484 family protein [bacterium]
MTQATNTNSDETPTLSETEVVEYLLSQPDFLARHPDVLKSLKVPHESGAAVSLLEHQVKLLRRETEANKKQLHQLIAIAQDNDKLNDRMHKLTLALIQAQTLEELVETLHRELRSQFHADAVELKMFDQGDLENHAEDPGLSVFQDFMKADRPTCGQLTEEQLQSLFGPAFGGCGSAALIPIHTQKMAGIMAIGSHKNDRFHPGMAVDFLVRFGELVSLALQSITSRGD